MKKLMIAACAIALAAVSQAATVSWNYVTSSGVYQGWKGTTIGGNYTSTYEDGSAYWIVTASYDQGDLLTALREGKTMSDTTIAAKVLDSGTLNGSKISPDVTKEVSDTLIQDGVISTYLVVKNGDNYYLGGVNEAEKDNLTGIYKVDIATTNTKKLRDNDGSHDYVSAGWYSTVPEPTSGLLLLLGVAGLALRRRRA